MSPVANLSLFVETRIVPSEPQRLTTLEAWLVDEIGRHWRRTRWPAQTRVLAELAATNDRQIRGILRGLEARGVIERVSARGGWLPARRCASSAEWVARLKRPRLPLTERRQRAADLHAAGKSYRQIAAELGIVPSLALADVRASAPPAMLIGPLPAPALGGLARMCARQLLR